MILGVVVINAIVGFVQEGRAERALDAIRDMLSPQAIVVREGRRARIPAEQLVPGDIVLLQAGDKVPADLRLAAAASLQLQEAALMQAAFDTVPIGWPEWRRIALLAVLVFLAIETEKAVVRRQRQPCPQAPARLIDAPRHDARRRVMPAVLAAALA